MGTIWRVAGSILMASFVAMQAWRMSDERNREAAWGDLATRANQPSEPFDPAMVRDLPDAARRYFTHTIAPGTPLCTVAEITMEGEIGLGDRSDPGYQPMRARQILAPPHGFVWRLESAGSGMVRMQGSDGLTGNRSWTRFWLAWTLPVARAGADADHLRASFGRAVAEAVFWAPAALLPRNGVRWEKGDTPDRARAVVTRGSLSQILEIEVANDGRPLWVRIPRWSNVNPEKEWRLQPFGGTMDDFRTFDGYTLPTRIEGGHHFGTAEYFPFFRVRVLHVRFPHPGERTGRNRDQLNLSGNGKGRTTRQDQP